MEDQKGKGILKKAAAGGLRKAKGKLNNVLLRSQVVVLARNRGGLFVGGGGGRCVWGVPLTSRDRKLARPNAAHFVRVS